MAGSNRSLLVIGMTVGASVFVWGQEVKNLVSLNRKIPVCNINYSWNGLNLGIRETRLTLDRKYALSSVENDLKGDYRRILFERTDTLKLAPSPPNLRLQQNSRMLSERVSALKLNYVDLEKKSKNGEMHYNFTGEYYREVIGPRRTEEEVISDGMMIFPMTDLSKKLYPFATLIYFDPKNNFMAGFGLNFKF